MVGNDMSAGKKVSSMWKLDEKHLKNSTVKNCNLFGAKSHDAEELECEEKPKMKISMPNNMSREKVCPTADNCTYLAGNVLPRQFWPIKFRPDHQDAIRNFDQEVSNFVIFNVFPISIHFFEN